MFHSVAGVPAPAWICAGARRIVAILGPPSWPSRKNGLPPGFPFFVSIQRLRPGTRVWIMVTSSPDPRPEYYRRRGDIFGGLRLWRIIRRRSCFAPGICRVAPRSRRPSTNVREYFQFPQLSRANCAFANERRAMDSPPCLTMCPCVRFSLIKMSIGLTCASCSRRKSPEFVHLQTESVYRNARSRFYSAPECLVRML